MILIVRLLYLMLVWHSAQLYAPDGSRFAFYIVVGLVPPALAWMTEELGARGIDDQGASRAGVVLLAAVESLAGVVTATVPWWMAAVPVFSGLAVVVCAVVGVAHAIAGSVHIAWADDGLHIRQRRRTLLCAWDHLRAGRTGRTFWFESEGKRVVARFSLARGELIRAELVARGVPLVEAPAHEPSLAPAFVIGLVASLLPMLIAAR